MNSLPCILLFIFISMVSRVYATEDCFPVEVETLAAEVLDQVDSMSLKEYRIQTTYSDDCFPRISNRKSTILIAEIQQGSLETGIEKGKKGSLNSEIGSTWNIRVNASYFDKKGKPTLFLKDKNHSLGEKKNNRGGVFYCLRGKCGIRPASQFKELPEHAVAIQSVPRLINNSQYTIGVHHSNVSDQRMGLAISNKNELIIFQSHRSSFNELRFFLLNKLNVKEALALDGGSSTSFHSLSVDKAGRVFEINETHYFWVGVPYFLNISNGKY